MKKKLIQYLIVLTVFVFGACTTKTQTSMMSNVTGQAGDVIVVINPEIWEGSIGQSLKDALMEAQYGLPQDEPLFNLINIPIEAYRDIFKTTRNIIEVKISPGAAESGISFKRNVHAYTQAMVSLVARDQSEMSKLVQEKADKILGFFMTAERERLTINYERYFSKPVYSAVEKEFGFTLNVPPGFEVVKKDQDFMWVRYDPSEISQGILIYTYPYESDSTFTTDYILGKRNVVLRKQVPGPTKGSYMSTEMQLPALMNIINVNGNYAAETRGLWRLENDFMGGPFVSLTILDMLNKRVVVLDGYVYAPSKNKRNLLRQIEAMIYSIKFTNQAEMDKINKQYNL